MNYIFAFSVILPRSYSWFVEHSWLLSLPLLIARRLYLSKYPGPQSSRWCVLRTNLCSCLCIYQRRGPWCRLLSVLACAHLWLGPCTYLGHGPWGRLRSVLACTRAQVIRTGASFTWHANNGNHVTAQYRSAYPRWNAPLFGANFSRLVYFCIIGHKLR